MRGGGGVSRSAAAARRPRTLASPSRRHRSPPRSSRRRCVGDGFGLALPLALDRRSSAASAADARVVHERQIDLRHLFRRRLERESRRPPRSTTISSAIGSSGASPSTARGRHRLVERHRRARRRATRIGFHASVAAISALTASATTIHAPAKPSELQQVERGEAAPESRAAARPRAARPSPSAERHRQQQDDAERGRSSTTGPSPRSSAAEEAERVDGGQRAEGGPPPASRSSRRRTAARRQRAHRPDVAAYVARADRSCASAGRGERDRGAKKDREQQKDDAGDLAPSVVLPNDGRYRSRSARAW